MQQDASSLETDREKRLRALEEQEKAAHEAEDRARTKSSKYSDKGDFINGLNRTAGNMNLGDRIGRRAGQGFIKEEEWICFFVYVEDDGGVLLLHGYP